MKDRAFTLIETIVVVGIIIIFFAVSAPLFSRLGKGTKLNTSARSVMSVLRTARGYAISENTNYYVFFDTTTTPHEYYISNMDDGSNVIEKKYRLPVGMSFSSIGFTKGAGGDAALFKSTGELDEGASTSVTVSDAGGRTKTINVEKTTGRVKIE